MSMVTDVTKENLLCQEAFNRFSLAFVNDIPQRVKAMRYIDVEVYGWEKRLEHKLNILTDVPTVGRFRLEAYRDRMGLMWKRLQQLTKKPFVKEAWTKPNLSDKDAAELVYLFRQLREVFIFFEHGLSLLDN